jgi:sialate O-acetylesterase
MTLSRLQLKAARFKSNAYLFASTIGLVFTLGLTARAQVRLPAVFTSHMVIQRNQPVRVWGWAGRHEAVTVTFREHSAATQADDLGRWEADLPPDAAGGPFQLVVKGSTTVSLDDVMVGDVWLASGQSNMEFPMTDLLEPQKQIAAASCPKVRLFRVEHKASEYPLDDVQAAPWALCGPATVSGFSAVAYFFAKEISERENVTVGVVESNWGGTLAESWTSLDALSADAGLMPVFAARAHMMDTQIARTLQQKMDEQDKAAGIAVPERPWNPLPEMWEPAALFNGMIAPLTHFSIRGVVWYQGESNSALDRAPSYARLFPAMIADWRTHWAEGNFPFLFTQISNFKSGPNEDWATIRDAQRRTLSVANTAMAVTIDVGNPDNVHPKDKATVGHRLALAARHLVYGEDVEDAGPLFRETSRQDHSLRVWFDHAQGLHAQGGEVRGFELAGADGVFKPASARLDADTLVVTSPAVPSPVNVRYDWANSPDGNLFNRAGLPMSPFKSAN